MGDGLSGDTGQVLRQELIVNRVKLSEVRRKSHLVYGVVTRGDMEVGVTFCSEFVTNSDSVAMCWLVSVL